MSLECIAQFFENVLGRDRVGTLSYEGPDPPIGDVRVRVTGEISPRGLLVQDLSDMGVWGGRASAPKVDQFRSLTKPWRHGSPFMIS